MNDTTPEASPPLPDPPVPARAAPAAVVAPPAPVAATIGLLLPLAAVMALLLLVVLLAGSALRWLLFSEDGARWVLTHAPLVQASGFKGALLGERWQADRLVVQWDGGRASVTIEDLDATGLRWRWRPDEHAWLGVEATALQARRVVLDSGPPGSQPPQPPASLAWPIHVAVAQAKLQTLQLDSLPAASELSLRDFQLDARPGGTHHVGTLTLHWQGLFAEAGATLGNQAPLPLRAQATLRPLGSGDAPAWAAVLRTEGTLPALQLSGTLRGVPRPGHDAPVLDLRAGLKPLQRWPLAELSLHTQALDLSALWSAAPQTRLAGSAEIDSRGTDAPLTALVTLSNSQPGRWNEGRLPVQALSAEIGGRLDQPDRIELRRFELKLADATRAAGVWSGSALWQAHTLSLQTRLLALAPQRLDGRAAAMVLSGPLEARLLGLPSPDPAATTPRPEPRLEWQLDLQGTLDAAPQPVRLQLEGSLDEQRLALDKLQLASGKARAEGRALLQRSGRGDWRLQTAGSLVDFDPLPWWPGDSDNPWRKGPHRLSADWQLDAQLPTPRAGQPLLVLAQRVAGNGRLRINDSLLAGVPLAADLALDHAPAAAASPATLHGQMQLAGNVLKVDGRGDPAGPGAADRLQVELIADNLQPLAPLARLHPALADWLPRQGSAQGTVTLDGRWPELRTEGTVRLQGVQTSALALARGSATWRMGTTGEQPLSLLAEASGLQWGRRRADSLRAELRGNLAEHQIQLSAALPVSPHPDAMRLLGLAAGSGTLAQMQALGGWRADPGGGGRWQARVERIAVGAWDGSAGHETMAAGWATARELRTELTFNAAGDLLSLRADAGRLQAADGLALRWDEVRMDFTRPAPDLALRADIEPFAVAPLLARLQPGLGVEGDLRVSARLDVRAGEQMEAEVVVQRHDGDLHLAGPEGRQAMGLSEARLALSAHDGVWLFTPTLKGRSLGEITGSARLQTASQHRWPAPEALLEGSVQARVADLGIWSAWVPPGWRLAGELRVAAQLGGRFADPRYTGEITGSGLAVRNLLNGVNVSDGDVHVLLQGDTARIERFTLRGGEGRLTLSGGASFGPSPQMKVQAHAERFRALGRVDRTVIASGDAELGLAGGRFRLDGKLVVDEGLFDTSHGSAPALDDDVTVRRPGDQPPPEAPPAPRARSDFALNLDIDLGDNLRLRGHGLDTGLAGRLRLSAPAGQLAVHGSISSEDGTYAAYGQKLEIERGIVAFSGSADNPRLDVLALRPNTDTRVGVLITGNLEAPRVRLYSEPEMSESEKLSWLVLGRAPDGLGRSDTALLQRAAVALLAGEGEAPTDALLRNLGIDEISLRQSEGDVRETVVTLGKQLSRRWYLGYERGVNSTTGTWQLIYRIAQRFTLRAQSGLDSSLDVIWVWRAQPPAVDAANRRTVVLPD